MELEKLQKSTVERLRTVRKEHELAPSGSAVVGFLCSMGSLSYSSFLIRSKSVLNGSNSAFVI